MDDNLFYSRLAPKIVSLANKAGDAIMEVYSSDDFGEQIKKDKSPLTRADLASNDIIIAGLENITPDIPILSEESKQIPFQERRGWDKYWLIDPLDGTKEFIGRRDEFTVNIALIEGSCPILGAVYAPAIGDAYFAIKGEGSFKTTDGAEPERIGAGDYRNGVLKIITTRSHKTEELEEFLGKIGPHECLNIGSSLKLCKVADGSAHLYPRLGPTMEWDTAAAQIVVEEAGGLVTDFTGIPLEYNKENLLNPNFIVSGNPPFPWQGFWGSQKGL